MSNKSIERIALIKKKIEFIQNIVREQGSIVHALEDEQNARAAILMHLTAIAEQI